MENKERSTRNKTITLTPCEIEHYSKMCSNTPTGGAVVNEVFYNKFEETIHEIPNNIFDLIIIDPPYNLSKDFNGWKFNKMGFNNYLDYCMSWLKPCVDKLKPNGSLYLCGEWRATAALQIALTSCNLHIMNRITWKRDKGRGASKNYKNNMEDIWFAVKDKNNYTFNVDAIKDKKKVIAPYKDKEGNAKDWVDSKDGKFRLTYPSNIMTNITIPYWSMAENTDHPTQKPEKLMAKLILASTNPGDVVFDPFAGCGSTLVTAKKLNRLYSGIEMNKEYVALTQYRLELATDNKTIQGYDGNCFLD